MFKMLVHSQSLEEDGKDTAEGNESEGNGKDEEFPSRRQVIRLVLHTRMFFPDMVKHSGTLW